MSKIRVSPYLAFLGLGIGVAVVGSPLEGQILPGSPRPEDRWEVEKARFRALILERVNVTLTAWQEAWARDDGSAITDSYSENGTVILAENPWRGRQEIHDGFGDFLPRIGPISHSLSSFEAGGSVATLLGHFHYRSEGSETMGETV